MQRALLVTPVVPAATGNGLAMRAGLWLDALHHHVETDVAVVPVFPAPRTAPAYTRTLARTSHVITTAMNSDDRLPQTVPVLDEAGRTRLRELAAGADLVVVFRLFLAEAAEIAHASGARVLLDLDDLDWVREERLGHQSEAEKYRALATAVLDKVDAITCASGADVAAISSRAPEVPVLHAPNGIRDPQPLESDTSDGPVDLLFVGTLGYQPNADGVRWLVHEVAPILPGVRIAIVGAAPGPDVLALAGAHVVVAGDVADLAPWYSRACVVVAPIHAGAGTRIKIAEAWAHRRPVVSTTLGAEGLDAEGALLIGDSSEEFAACCRMLLADPPRAEQLADAGWSRYQKGHAWEHAVACADIAIHAATKA